MTVDFVHNKWNTNIVRINRNYDRVKQPHLYYSLCYMKEDELLVMTEPFVPNLQRFCLSDTLEIAPEFDKTLPKVFWTNMISEIWDIFIGLRNHKYQMLKEELNDKTVEIENAMKEWSIS